MKAGDFVVVTTVHRGVFAGILEKHDVVQKTVTLKDGRMCVQWATKVRGIVGLARLGPTKYCRVTPSAPKMYLYDVTAVMLCTEDARKAWEKEPWG